MIKNIQVTKEQLKLVSIEVGSLISTEDVFFGMTEQEESEWILENAPNCEFEFGSLAFKSDVLEGGFNL